MTKVFHNVTSAFYPYCIDHKRAKYNTAKSVLYNEESSKVTYSVRRSGLELAVSRRKSNLAEHGLNVGGMERLTNIRYGGTGFHDGVTCTPAGTSRVAVQFFENTVFGVFTTKKLQLKH